jgi:hypothetical protein
VRAPSDCKSGQSGIRAASGAKFSGPGREAACTREARQGFSRVCRQPHR